MENLVPYYRKLTRFYKDALYYRELAEKSPAALSRLYEKTDKFVSLLEDLRDSFEDTCNEVGLNTLMFFKLLEYPLAYMKEFVDYLFDIMCEILLSLKKEATYELRSN